MKRISAQHFCLKKMLLIIIAKTAQHYSLENAPRNIDQAEIHNAYDQNTLFHLKKKCVFLVWKMLFFWLELSRMFQLYNRSLLKLQLKHAKSRFAASKKRAFCEHKPAPFLYEQMKQQMVAKCRHRWAPPCKIQRR